MLKTFTKGITAAIFLTVGLAGASAQSGPYDNWEGDGATYYRYCDNASCYSYWNTGTPDDPNWVLVSVEPRRPGGQHEN